MSNKKVSIDHKNVFKWEDALYYAAQINPGIYACYSAIREDISLANFDRAIAEKGYWVFDRIQETAKKIQNLHPQYAQSLQEICVFYETNDLVNPKRS
jgi:hypothetical protein